MLLYNKTITWKFVCMKCEFYTNQRVFVIWMDYVFGTKLYFDRKDLDHVLQIYITKPTQLGAATN